MKRSIKSKFNFSSLMAKIIIVVLVGVMLMASINILVVNRVAEDFFNNVYGSSQEKVIVKVKEEIENYFEQINEVALNIGTSWNVQKYLSSIFNDSVAESEVIFEMKKDISSTIPDKLKGITVLLISTDGRVVIDNGDVLSTSVSEILKNSAITDSKENSNNIIFQYTDKGFTNSTKDSGVIMGVKSIRATLQNSLCGYMVILIPESELSKFYSYGQNDYNFISVLDNSNRVISSTDKSLLGTVDNAMGNKAKQMIESGTVISQYKNKSEKDMIICKNISYIKDKLCVVIDDKRALKNYYNTYELTLSLVIIAGVMLVIIIFLISATMRPLKRLREKMSYVKDGDFSHQVVVKGNGEITELAQTYNKMLEDINRYIDSLMEIENDKRKAEINALQMQINPHYIYNTLTSIKWLIMQGDVRKSTKALDAFIALLRSTVSNKDEFISIEDEINNLKEYMYINNLRYGEKIKGEFFIGLREPQLITIPKMILQPFIENAFFHAFPSGENGNIMLFVREQGEFIRIEITDDGIGMSEEEIAGFYENEVKEKNKGEHFTGIGIKNIINRLKLIYNKDYKVEIKSEIGNGTTIILLLKKKLH